MKYCIFLIPDIVLFVNFVVFLNQPLIFFKYLFFMVKKKDVHLSNTSLGWHEMT